MSCTHYSNCTTVLFNYEYRKHNAVFFHMLLFNNQVKSPPFMSVAVLKGQPTMTEPRWIASFRFTSKKLNQDNTENISETQS